MLYSYVTSRKSATTTVIVAVSALGETIPPNIIFKGERMSKEIRSDVVPGPLQLGGLI